MRIIVVGDLGQNTDSGGHRIYRVMYACSRRRVAAVGGAYVFVVAADRRERAHPVPLTRIDRAKVVVVALDSVAERLRTTSPASAYERHPVAAALIVVVGGVVVARRLSRGKTARAPIEGADVAVVAVDAVAWIVEVYAATRTGGE